MMPCGEVHWKILPAVSREIAVCLEKEGVERSKIAFALGTSTAAVSQYISGKRGGMRLGKKTSDACKVLAGKIASGKVKGGKTNLEIARVIAIAKKTNLGDSDPCVVCAGGKKA